MCKRLFIRFVYVYSRTLLANYISEKYRVNKNKEYSDFPLFHYNENSFSENLYGLSRGSSFRSLEFRRCVGKSRACKMDKRNGRKRDACCYGFDVVSVTVCLGSEVCDDFARRTMYVRIRAPFSFFHFFATVRSLFAKVIRAISEKIIAKVLLARAFS